MNVKKLYCLLGLLLMHGFGLAGTCEFRASGDQRNGLTFKARMHVPGLAIQSALGQLQHLALEGGYTLGHESIHGSSGRLSFLQTSNQPPLVIWAEADDSGMVSLTMTLARSQKVESAAVEAEFCGLLAKLKPGKAGEELASAARAKSGLDKIISIEAVALSKQLDKEIKKALAPANKDSLLRILGGKDREATPKEYEELFSPIRAKYLGQKYRIDGQIFAISNPANVKNIHELVNPHLEIIYDVRTRRGLLGVREDTTQQDLHFKIICRLAKDQYDFFKSLSEGDFATLAGTVIEITPSGMVIGEARQAKK